MGIGGAPRGGDHRRRHALPGRRDHGAAHRARRQAAGPPAQPRLRPGGVARTEDLAPGEHIVFSATGVTDGELLKGVRFFGGGSRTSTLFMSLSRQIIRFVDTIRRESTSGPGPCDRAAMIKPDRWIRAWGEAGGVEPYEPAQVNAASYDVRLSRHWICPTRDPEEFRADRLQISPARSSSPRRSSTCAVRRSITFVAQAQVDARPAVDRPLAGRLSETRGSRATSPWSCRTSGPPPSCSKPAAGSPN